MLNVEFHGDIEDHVPVVYESFLECDYCVNDCYLAASIHVVEKKDSEYEVLRTGCGDQNKGRGWVAHVFIVYLVCD